MLIRCHYYFQLPPRDVVSRATGRSYFQPRAHCHLEASLSSARAAAGIRGVGTRCQLTGSFSRTSVRTWLRHAPLFREIHNPHFTEVCSFDPQIQWKSKLIKLLISLARFIRFTQSCWIHIFKKKYRHLRLPFWGWRLLPEAKGETNFKWLP